MPRKASQRSIKRKQDKATLEEQMFAALARILIRCDEVDQRHKQAERAAAESDNQ